MVIPISAFGLEPLKEESIVYKMRPYAVREYATVFAPAQVEEIYLIADSDNTFDPRYTMVYYWPLSQEYFQSWEKLDVEAPGRLEVWSKGRMLARLPREAAVFGIREELRSRKRCCSRAVRQSRSMMNTSGVTISISKRAPTMA
jgi:hypothetical protein